MPSINISSEETIYDSNSSFLQTIFSPKRSLNILLSSKKKKTSQNHTNHNKLFFTQQGIIKDLGDQTWRVFYQTATLDGAPRIPAKKISISQENSYGLELLHLFGAQKRVFSCRVDRLKLLFSTTLRFWIIGVIGCPARVAKGDSTSRISRKLAAHPRGSFVVRRVNSWPFFLNESALSLVARPFEMETSKTDSGFRTSRLGFQIPNAGSRRIFSTKDGNLDYKLKA
ncbi:hypothetical protein CEXT_533041 [Caerostris extrusa]|uniref:Uncharacterized protein n=1 Tax=Caerostris extrusa TaxID=172846 RepID=A0AAV4PK27_CAEEX|nr:hypothetical protein CEXT_533041 [Caerostris extrusa]